MKKNFIPREKMGRKARRLLDAQRRVTWPLSPASKTFGSKKAYSRKRKNRDWLTDDSTGGFSYVLPKV